MSRYLLAGVVIGFSVAVVLLSSLSRPIRSPPDAGLVIRSMGSEKLTAMQQPLPMNLDAQPPADGGTPR